MKPYLSVIQQVPEFVRADYPAFIEFLKAYYQWLEEEYSTGKLEDLVDIDNTVDGFLKYFRKQLDVYGITANTSNRNYLQHIKELYASKGSFASFEFLFRILYDKPSSIIQPWDYAFKPSEGVWTQDTSILVDVQLGDVNTILSSSVMITDDAGRVYKTYVRDISIRRDGVAEIFIKRFTPYNNLVTVASTDGSFVGNILNTTVKAKVLKGGSGFKIGQVFNANTSSGLGTLIKVKSVDLNGSIKAIEIITFGTGYTTDFNLLISANNQVDVGTLGARITLGQYDNFDIDQWREDHPGEPLPTPDGQSTYQSNENLNSQNESGLIVKHDYTNLLTGYLTDPTYVGDQVGDIKSQPYTVYRNDSYASIQITVGQLCIYPGYYQNSTNIIGDLVYIQDSYYYQAFSYVTVIEESLSSYGDLLRKVLHPAGTKHFGVHQINNAFQISLTASAALNLIAKADALRDFISAVEQIIFVLERNFTDEVTVADVTTTVGSFIRSFTDESIITDARTFDIRPVFADVVNLAESITIVPGVLFTNLVTTSHLVSFDADKYLSNSIQTSSSGGVWMDPYTEVQPDYYWTPGYLENERAITN